MKEGKKEKTSKPNVENPNQKDQWTEGSVKWVLHDLTTVGFWGLPKLIPDHRFIQVAIKAIKEEGVEQYLSNMIHILRSYDFKVIPK